MNEHRVGFRRRLSNLGVFVFWSWVLIPILFFSCIVFALVGVLSFFSDHPSGTFFSDSWFYFWLSLLFGCIQVFNMVCFFRRFEKKSATDLVTFYIQGFWWTDFGFDVLTGFCKVLDRDGKKGEKVNFPLYIVDLYGWRYRHERAEQSINFGEWVEIKVILLLPRVCLVCRRPVFVCRRLSSSVK